MTKQLALKEDWIPWRLRLRRFFMRHHHMLPTVGALIVFLTFVIRDNVREHFKSLAANLDTAESILAIRADTTTVRMTLKHMQSQIGVVSQNLQSVARRKPFVDYRESDLIDPLEIEVMEKVHLEPGEEEQGVAMLSALEAACRNLPKSHASCLRRREMQDELTLAMDVAGSNYQGEKEDWRWTEEQLQTLSDKEKRLLAIQGDHPKPFSLRLGELYTQIITDAEKIRSDAEDTNRLLGRMSIGLYTLGFGLGLLSKIYGVDTGAAD